MIGRAPAWTIWVTGVIATIWIIPIIGIVVTPVRPPSEVALRWWRLDQFSLTLDAWIKVWDEYPLAKAFWTTAQLAAIATCATMLLTPAAAYAFHFLKFPFRRTFTSGLNADGSFAVDAGIRSTGPVPFNPSYVRAGRDLATALTATPFVMYGVGQAIVAQGAAVLAEIGPSYFNRSYRHFSSHQHAPDDPAAASLGAAVTFNGAVGYVAYPIFSMYHAMGQPLYKYVIDGLIDRLLSSRAILTDLPSSARATLTRQAEQERHILHLLYGAPQVRGKAVPSGEGVRVMEMIEDIPTLVTFTASVRLPRSPSRVYDALTGDDVPFSNVDGRVEVRLSGLRIHAALVFEDSV